MKGSWLHYVRGSAAVRIGGTDVEAFVNAAAADGLQLISLRRTSRGAIECEVTLQDFFRLRPYLRRTGCRVRVLRRSGLPFLLAKLERRKFFAAGIAVFFIGMYLLSALVWRVEVSGNERLTDEQILAAARAEGIHPYQWSFKLPESDMLSKRLSVKLPGIAWVGVEKRGTLITIRVVETTEPEPKELLSPRHLVASEDAVVTEISAERGRPVAKRNQRVRKGDILISGTLGDEEASVDIPAVGTVRGLVWHEYRIVSPLTRKEKVYTGERKVQWFAVIGGRALQLSGFGDPKFEKAERVQHRESAAWRGRELPFGRMRQTVLEVRYDQRRITEEEAAEAGLLQARADILSKSGTDADIRDQKILHRTTENGKVYMKVLFEVEQSIAVELPIVHLQGE